MAKYVTAGVEWREIDLSLYSQKLSSTILGMAGLFTKGPVNEHVFIGTEDELVATFGPPTPNAQAFYAAREFLKRGNKMQIVRVGHAATLTYATANAKDVGLTDSIRFDGITKGSGFNNYMVVLSTGTVTGRKVQVKDPTGILLETFDNILRANAEANINGISKYITCTVLTAGAPGEPTNQSLALTGGQDGITGLTDSDVIGSVTPSGRTGLQCFRNPEEVDINLVAAPGMSSPNIVNEIIGIAEARADTLGLVDPPYDLNYQEVRDWHNGEGAWIGIMTKLNTSYAALYWDWQRVYDPYNNLDVQTAPSGHAARVMAYTDAIAFPWFAPAGLRRGLVKGSSGMNHSPDWDQRDYLGGAGQNVNSIVNFVSDGAAIFAQKTLQRATTALDRVNVRRMLLYVEKNIATLVRYISFEPDDPTTWREFKGLANPVLRYVLANRGVRDFLVVCDSTTNTSDITDQNKMYAKIFIKPTKAAEKIEIDAILTAQGASFTELLAA